MKRLTSLIAAVGLIAAGSAFLLAGGIAGAQPTSQLPTMTLTLNGGTVTVGGSLVSGAVNIVSTTTGNDEPALVRLNPGVSFSAFAQATQAVGSHHGDLNYLDPYASLVYDGMQMKGTQSAQVDLQPGNYFALNTASNGNGPPPHEAFTVTTSSSPAALPNPSATESSIEFGFTGPTKLHTGELVRFQNLGFLVHMDVWIRAKNMAAAKTVVTLLLAGKDRKVGRKLVTGFGTFAGPLSSGAVQQQMITAKPGIYVQACFMDTQDGREHTQLGMERIVKIVK